MAVILLLFDFFFIVAPVVFGFGLSNFAISLLRKTELVALHLSRDMRFPTMWYVRPAKAQISIFRVFDSRLNIL